MSKVCSLVNHGRKPVVASRFLPPLYTSILFFSFWPAWTALLLTSQPQLLPLPFSIVDIYISPRLYWWYLSSYMPNKISEIKNALASSHLVDGIGKPTYKRNQIEKCARTRLSLPEVSKDAEMIMLCVINEEIK